MTQLPSALRECPSILALAVSREGTILDCSRTFLERLNLAGSPAGSPLLPFLSGPPVSLNEMLDEAAKSGENVSFLFQAPDGSLFPVEACIGKENETFLLIAFLNRFKENEIISKMSALNLEMANLTRELTKKNRELEEANAVISRLMNTDPLTGISNRRHFEAVAEKALSFSRRQGHPVSLIMADIDHFKTFNDRFGHAMGDEVLVAFAQMLFRSCRFEDTVCRYGGEEFLVLLPGVALVPARKIAERLRENTEHLFIPGLEEGIRASFGVAEFLSDETLEGLISRADQALYKAKARGRNRVEG
jgi:diguanylate cyclase (GGDEF)-like protein